MIISVRNRKIPEWRNILNRIPLIFCIRIKIYWNRDLICTSFNIRLSGQSVPADTKKNEDLSSSENIREKNNRNDRLFISEFQHAGLIYQVTRASWSNKDHSVFFCVDITLHRANAFSISILFCLLIDSRPSCRISDSYCRTYDFAFAGAFL
jgi:hypothetical protein